MLGERAGKRANFPGSPSQNGAGRKGATRCVGGGCPGPGDDGGGRVLLPSRRRRRILVVASRPGAHTRTVDRKSARVRSAGIGSAKDLPHSGSRPIHHLSRQGVGDGFPRWDVPGGCVAGGAGGFVGGAGVQSVDLREEARRRVRLSPRVWDSALPSQPQGWALRGAGEGATAGGEGGGGPGAGEPRAGAGEDSGAGEGRTASGDAREEALRPEEVRADVVRARRVSWCEARRLEASPCRGGAPPGACQRRWARRRRPTGWSVCSFRRCCSTVSRCSATRSPETVSSWASVTPLPRYRNR